MSLRIEIDRLLDRFDADPVLSRVLEDDLEDLARQAHLDRGMWYPETSIWPSDSLGWKAKTIMRMNEELIMVLSELLSEQKR